MLLQNIMARCSPEILGGAYSTLNVIQSKIILFQSMPQFGGNCFVTTEALFPSTAI